VNILLTHIQRNVDN